MEFFCVYGTVTHYRVVLLRDVGDLVVEELECRTLLRVVKDQVIVFLSSTNIS